MHPSFFNTFIECIMFRFMFVLLFATASFVQAQTVVVREERSGRPLDNVSVMSTNPPALHHTNVHGQVDIARFGSADTLYLSRLGFEPVAVPRDLLVALKEDVRMREQPFRLDEVVVAATRWRTAQSDLPQRVSRIDALDVQARQPQTVADLLGSSGEVFVQKSQLAGGSPMLRGFATNRVLIAVDGIRMNTAIFRNDNVQNIIALDALALQDAEVVFGPGSVSYGSDAIGGVMSFQTLDARLSHDERPLLYGSALLRGSSAGEEKTGHVDIGLGLRTWAFVSSVTWSEFGDLRMGSDGPDDYLRPDISVRANGRDSTIRNTDPEVQTPSGYRQWNVMQKIRFAPTAHWDVQYAGHYSRSSDAPRYDRLLRRRGTLPYHAEWYYGPQIWSLHALTLRHQSPTAIWDNAQVTAAWQYFEESRHDRDFGKSARYHRTETVRAWTLNAGAELSVAQRHSISYGLEFVHNLVGSVGEQEDAVNGVWRPASTRYPDGASWTSSALFLHHRWTLSERLVLQSGLRGNYVTLDAEFNSAFYPFPFKDVRLRNVAVNGSAGALYRPGDDWQVNVILSTGYRAPNVDDMGKVFDSTPGAVVVPNPDLAPEYAWNIEAGIGKRFGSWLRFDVTAFHTWLDNAMVLRDFQLNGQDTVMYSGQPSRVEALQNAAVAFVQGVQARVETHLGHGLRAWAGMTWLDGEGEMDDGSTAPLRHVGPAYGTAHLLWSGAGMEVDAYVMHNGGMDYEDMATAEQSKTYLYALDASGKPYVPSFLTWNLKASYRLSDLVQLMLGVENITDLRYRPYSSGITAAGRNLIGSIRLRF